jgi:hypothetical protein
MARTVDGSPSYPGARGCDGTRRGVAQGRDLAPGADQEDDMRYAFTLLAASMLYGCSGESTPPLPTVPVAPDAPDGLEAPAVPTPNPSAPTGGAGVPGSGILWVLVVEASGRCITGASVQLVVDQRVVSSGTQTTPCDVWSGDGGVLFRGLTFGDSITVRASHLSHGAREVTATPTVNLQAVEIVLGSTPSPDQ